MEKLEQEVLYHSLKQANKILNGASTKWLNIKSLCESYLPHISKDARLKNIYYFSALAHHTTINKVNRHRKYIKCLENTGIIKELGRFKGKHIECSYCNRINKRHEEKETDVAIGVKLIEIVIKKECDSIVIISGDTDLSPAVKFIHKMYKGIKIYFIFPFGRKNKELNNIVCGNSFNIKPKKYLQHQFPNPVILSSGKKIYKPSSW